MQVNIAANLIELNERILRACQRSGRRPAEIITVAVTKTIGIEAIREAYGYGIRNFGENRIQEARGKIENELLKLPDIRWHMVGHLQSNKAGLAVKFFDLIHSVDSFKLAEVLNRLTPHKLPVLIQVNVSGEPSKYGVEPSMVGELVEKIRGLQNLEVQGLMTIAPLTDDTGSIRSCFRRLRQLAEQYNLKHLSMGMSDDFAIAIEEGATIIRIGRAIFGERR